MTSNVTKGALATIEELQHKMGSSDSEVVQHLGYRGSSNLSQWRKAKVAPVVAGLAAEALIRRIGKHEPLSNDGERIIVARVDPEDFEFLTAIATKLGVKLTEI